MPSTAVHDVTVFVLPKSAGFTLLEILVALGLLAVISSVAIPVLIKPAGVELRASARTLVAALRHTRDHAVTHNESAALTINVEKRNFKVPGRDRVYELPKKAEIKLFTAKSELIEDGGRVRFFPDGSATGGRITLIRNKHVLYVDVDWFTGRVSLLNEEQVGDREPDDLVLR